MNREAEITSEGNSENIQDTAEAAQFAAESDPQITDFLTEDRILLDLETTSRKRLFEHIAEVSSKGIEEVGEDRIFKTIAERERLGSTGLGQGVAVPHGRIADLTVPIITVARLKHSVDYDAPDNLPVWLAVALLVPEKANDTHLKLLSTLAGCFQNQDFISAIKTCQNSSRVLQLFKQISIE